MRQTFVIRVKEKEAELKEAEKEVGVAYFTLPMADVPEGRSSSQWIVDKISCNFEVSAFGFQHSVIFSIFPSFPTASDEVREPQEAACRGEEKDRGQEEEPRGRGHHLPEEEGCPPCQQPNCST